MLNIKDAYSHPLFYKGLDEKTGFRTRLVDLCTYQLKLQPPPSPTPGKGGVMWRIFIVFEAWLARGGEGFLRICFAYS